MDQALTVQIEKLKQENGRLRLQLSRAEKKASFSEKSLSEVQGRLSDLEAASRKIVRRYDLEGLRLKSGSNVWLVMHGCRRKIMSPRVYDSLFKGVNLLQETEILEDILEGPPLYDGTCLLRSIESGIIFLAVCDSDDYSIHAIDNDEIFGRFGFDRSLVYSVPGFLIDQAKIGRSLLIKRV